MTKFETIRNQYPGISLRKFCETTSLCYQYVLKASKLPIAGQAYDPTQINFDEVQKIIDRREGLNLDSFDWEAISAEAAASRAAQAPVNKQEDFDIGTEFKLREPKGTEGTPIYFVVYTTATHIVFQYIDDTQPRVMNWDTFMHQSPRILTKAMKEEEQA